MDTIIIECDSDGDYGYTSKWVVKSDPKRIVDYKARIKSQLDKIASGSSSSKFLFVGKDLILQIDTIRSIKYEREQEVDV